MEMASTQSKPACCCVVGQLGCVLLWCHISMYIKEIEEKETKIPQQIGLETGYKRPETASGACQRLHSRLAVF